MSVEEPAPASACPPPSRYNAVPATCPAKCSTRRLPAISGQVRYSPALVWERKSQTRLRETKTNWQQATANSLLPQGEVAQVHRACQRQPKVPSQALAVVVATDARLQHARVAQDLRQVRRKLRAVERQKPYQQAAPRVRRQLEQGDHLGAAVHRHLREERQLTLFLILGDSFNTRAFGVDFQ